MNHDSRLIFEAYTDLLTQKKRELAGNIMDIIRYGIPEEKEIPVLKAKLLEIFKAIKERGNRPTNEEVSQARHIMGQLRASGMTKMELVNLYKHGEPEKEKEEYSAQDYAKEMEVKGEGEEGKDEEAEMPYPEFAKLSKHASPKNTKEKEETNSEIHDLAKLDSREEHSEDEEKNKHEVSNERNWVNSFHRTFGPGYKEELEKAGIDPYEHYVDYYGRLYEDDVIKKYTDIYNKKYPEYPVNADKLIMVMHIKREKPLEGHKHPGK